VAIGVGVAMVGVILLGRRWGPPVPRRPARRVGALLLSVAGVISIAGVGAVPSGVPPLRLELPWATCLACCSRARSSRASASPRRPPAPSLTTVIGSDLR